MSGEGFNGVGTGRYCGMARMGYHQGQVYGFNGFHQMGIYIAGGVGVGKSIGGSEVKDRNLINIDK